MDKITISQKYNFAQFEFDVEQENIICIVKFESKSMLESIFISSYSNYMGKNKNALKRKYERLRRMAKIEQ